MKRVLIDLEENGCTVKEAVDYLKGLGYFEGEYPVPASALILFTWGCGEIDSYSTRLADLQQYCVEECLEKLTIKQAPVENDASLKLSLSFDEALLVYHALLEYDVIGASESTVEVVNSAFEKAEQCVSSFVGFDPICVFIPSERKVKGDEFFRFSYVVKESMTKPTQEPPIVFSNPLMQHIGREVVVNDGRGDFSGWVVGVIDDWLTVDFEVQIEGYTHNADLVRGVETFRWVSLPSVKFVNEDGSLSDE